LESKGVDYVMVSFDSDTIKYYVNSTGANRPDEIFDGENFPDELDYLDEYTRLHIFTDRGIYKPGQTVFYKAILLSRDLKTGDMVIFNHGNMNSRQPSNAFQKWLQQNELVLQLRDPMNRNIDSIKMIPDAYGAFFGSFKIPKTASTGRWNIEPNDVLGANENPGSFQVEEYKRPTTEIILEKPKEVLLPGKSFSFKVKVKALNGAILDNTTVKINIKRSGYLPENALSFEKRRYDETVLVDTSMYTNAKGELTVVVNDSTLTSYQFTETEEWMFTYNAEFLALGSTGESAILQDQMYVSNLPIKINLQSEAVYDRAALPAIAVNTNAILAGPQSNVVKFQIHRIPSPTKTYEYGFKVDQGKESAALLAPTKKVLVFETSINTGSAEKLQLPKGQMPAGRYEITGIVQQGGRTLGKSTNYIDVFDSHLREVPDLQVPFAYLPSNLVKPGDKLRFFSGAADSTYSIYELHYFLNSNIRNSRHSYKVIQQGKGLQEYNFEVPKDAVDQLLLTKVYVLNNQIYKSNQTIYIANKVKDVPEIIIENYRRVLEPGSKQSFSVSIKTKDKRTAAQLMSVMYDASLDKLQTHKWSVPTLEKGYSYIPSGWPENINPLYTSRLINPRTLLSQYMDVQSVLSGRVAGLSIGNADDNLNEVVVVGYGERNKSYAVSANVIRIRGNSSLADYRQPLIILDGVVFTGDLNDINAASITEIMVLKDREALQIYGSKAAGGVLIVSTRGPITLPEPIAEPLLKIRKNFNETAFFLPAVYADKKGYYTMNLPFQKV
jgi:hypothetical protein